MLNRSAIVVKPKQPFLEWIHAADPTSLDLTVLDPLREPTMLVDLCDEPVIHAKFNMGRLADTI